MLSWGNGRAGGYQNSDWDSFKVELAGSMKIFDELEDALTLKVVLRPRRVD